MKTNNNKFNVNVQLDSRTTRIIVLVFGAIVIAAIALNISNSITVKQTKSSEVSVSK
jgi:uncharacterized membrane protein